MRESKCDTCGGSGVTRRVANPDSNYDPREHTDMRVEVCDECVGTGKDLKCGVVTKLSRLHSRLSGE